MSRKPLRIALYGFVGEDLGSMCSAHYLFCREALAAGHLIDFYAEDGFVHPGNLVEHPNFDFVPVLGSATKFVQGISRRIRPAALRELVLFGGAILLANRLNYLAIDKEMRRRHARKPYDAILSLGLLSPWKIPGVRTVSWTQGCPAGEYGWVMNHPLMLARQAGALFPLALTGVYVPKYVEAFFDHRKSDMIIGGSTWATKVWRRFGVPRRKLVALPYPMDLSRFAVVPKPADEPADRIAFLHLGRFVPRKRLDLLLAGFAAYRTTDPTARLRIVGNFAYAARARRMLDNPAWTTNVDYRAAVPRAEVPDLLARSDAVVQTSEHENFGTAVAEAQACGLPVVVGPTNGTAQYVGEGSVKFAEYTPAAVAAGLAEMARRVRAGRGALAAASRRAAEAHYSPEQVCRQVLDLLRRPESEEKR